MSEHRPGILTECSKHMTDIQDNCLKKSPDNPNIRNECSEHSPNVKEASSENTSRAHRECSELFHMWYEQRINRGSMQMVGHQMIYFPERK